MTETQEFVVPKSIPIIFPIFKLYFQFDESGKSIYMPLNIKLKTVTF
jgi:hypothetical protein